MADEILIFGAIGTQVVVDRKIFELVAIGGGGAVTWRTRCVVCRTPVFTEVRDGKLPIQARCNAHRALSRHPAVPELEYQYEAEVLEMAQKQPPAVISPGEFIAGVKAGMDRVIARELTATPVGDYIRQRQALAEQNSQQNLSVAEHGMRVVGQAHAAINALREMNPNAAPLVGSIKMHMGDEDATSVEAMVGNPHTGGPLTIEHDVDSSSADPEDDPYSTEGMLAELEDLAPDEDGVPPPLSDEDIWMPRLEMWYRDRMWSQAWGDRPDQSRCEAPPEFLARYRRG
jgi:hypothetical protein